jgi:hypothetical protein
MQRHNLGLILENEYLLIAIHSNVEDFKLVFLINKHLNLNLKRKATDLDLYKKEGHISFSVFEYYDTEREDIIYLINNSVKTVTEKTTSAGSLFDSSSEEKTHYLIPEYKQTEYFLKIVTDYPKFYERKLLSQLNSIQFLNTAYIVDQSKLKSKNNLNFD